MQASAVTSSLLVPAHDPIGPFLFLSASVHIVVVGAMLLFSYLTLPPPFDPNQKPITASLVRLGKPRDPNLLPQKEELPPPPPKSEGSEPVATPEKPPQPAVPVPIPIATRCVFRPRYWPAASGSW